MLVIEGEEVGRDGLSVSVSGLMWVHAVGFLGCGFSTGDTGHLKCSKKVKITLI